MQQDLRLRAESNKRPEQRAKREVQRANANCSEQRAKASSKVQSDRAGLKAATWKIGPHFATLSPLPSALCGRTLLLALVALPVILRRMLRGIFRTKNLDDILASAQEEGHKLKRTLGPINITLLGIGAIIGAGIFATVGTAAAGDASRPGAGPSLMLSFVITAVVCAFTALCYAEMAAMVPISGSAYTYSYATLGELVAWIIGWDLMLEYAIGNVAVAISWANYFRSFMHDA